ncbi:MAG: hypothetical protein ACTSPG_08680 [Candidatus Hodarchaeales archaeon]
MVNTGDYVQLLNSHDDYVDVVAYGVSAPDGSEQLNVPKAGESILRYPLYIDTDTTDDFSFGNPEPKGDVPHVPLSVSFEGEISLFWISTASVLIILPILRRRHR